MQYFMYHDDLINETHSNASYSDFYLYGTLWYS